MKIFIYFYQSSAVSTTQSSSSLLTHLPFLVFKSSTLLFADSIKKYHRFVIISAIDLTVMLVINFSLAIDSISDFSGMK